MAIAKQFVGIRQSKSEMYSFYVDGTGTAAIGEGKYHGSLTDNGTGDYTVTLTRPARRALQVVGIVPVTANVMPQNLVVDSSSVRVRFVDNDGTPTATDAKFYLTVLAYYDDQQR